MKDFYQMILENKNTDLPKRKNELNENVYYAAGNVAREIFESKSRFLEKLKERENNE